VVFDVKLLIGIILDPGCSAVDVKEKGRAAAHPDAISTFYFFFAPVFFLAAGLACALEGSSAALT
jgi:hypothetical protein